MVSVYSLHAVEVEINTPASGPLAAVGAGRQVCCSRALSRSPGEQTRSARWTVRSPAAGSSHSWLHRLTWCSVPAPGVCSLCPTPSHLLGSRSARRTSLTPPILCQFPPKQLRVINVRTATLRPQKELLVSSGLPAVRGHGGSR